MKKINQTILILAIIATTILPGLVFASETQSAVMDHVDVKISAATAPLQAQIDALKSQCASPASVINFGTDQRLTTLESRMAVLEKTVDFIIKNISTVLAQVISYLKK